MSKRFPEDKKRSKLDGVKLAQFPMGVATKIALAVTGVFALIGFATGGMISFAVIHQLLSPLRALAAKSEKIAKETLIN